MSGSEAASAATTDDLLEALEDGLGERFPGSGGIERLERRPSAYRTSFVIEDLTAHLGDGTAVELVFKDLSPEALSPAAQGAKPPFLFDPVREIETYRSILDKHKLGTPELYGATANPERGRYWLFLERVRGVELYQVGELERWREVARWLAHMHARLAPEAAGRAAERLLRYSADFYRRWPSRALKFARATATSSKLRRRFEEVVEDYERVVQRLVALPVTVIHGEFYASNVLVVTASGSAPSAAGLERVCPVDWEMTAVGPGLVDLAALTAGHGWPEDAREAMAEAYREVAAPGQRTRDLVLGLECCRLHLAVQWLGWSEEWTPPPEHRQDWLAEAARAADRLGL